MKAYNSDINFIAKKELFENKISAKVLSSFGAISIDRSSPDLKTLYIVLKKLRAGHKITISPEGTRNKTGSIDFLPFKPGAALFGVKGKCAIVPAIINRKAKIFKRTSIMFGEPFYLTEFANEDFNNENICKINDIIRNKMKETQKRLLDTVSKKRK
ncbi:MAG: 1-acyl-sn-glycerol-3-phosphate acyltransferase [Clostridia bacterium]|nr:1-acyl-sn-glycerol-3-phosphate acyltransferase [Clostridia bacterium]